MNDKRNTVKRNNYQKRKSKQCIYCGNKTTNKYCDSICQHRYMESEIFRKIELNIATFSSEETANRWIKRYLIHKFGEKCMDCGWMKVHPITNKVPVELEHIDGNGENNKLENVKLLCPNCHSLTPTYKALNIGKGRYKRKLRYISGKSY